VDKLQRQDIEVRAAVAEEFDAGRWEGAGPRSRPRVVELTRVPMTAVDIEVKVLGAGTLDEKCEGLFAVTHCGKAIAAGQLSGDDVLAQFEALVSTARAVLVSIVNAGGAQ